MQEAVMAFTWRDIHSRPPLALMRLQAFLAFLGETARKAALALKHRRDATALAGLDERMLRDIGLTRSDLRDAYAEPLWRDPTDILASRARDRRRPAPDAKAFFASPPLAPQDGFTVPDTNRPSHHTV
jgi:uncharacterized protein YjiS (DUF1127 family)